MPSFGRIDDEDQKKVISRVYWCISIIEKEKKVAGRVKCLGERDSARGP